LNELDTLKKHPSVLSMYQARVRLKKEGKEWVGKCVFHSGDNEPSLRVYQHDGTWIFKCFGCNSKGSIIDFIARQDKISVSQAIRKIEETVGKSWDKVKKQSQDWGKPLENEEPEIVYPIESYGAFEKSLAENSFVQNWLLVERGITYETAKRLRLGYRQTVKSNNPKVQDILDKGWIVFPRFQGNKVVGLHYRSIVRKAFTRQYGMGTFLFNADSIDPFSPLYVTEGEIDTCTLEQFGFNAVSIPSATTEITPEMRDQILEAEQVILAGDTDVNGAPAMNKLWSELQERTYLLRWPQGSKDANETFLKHCNRNGDAFRQLVEELTASAKLTPMPGVYSLQEEMKQSDRSTMADHPLRLHFPWSRVDSMVNVLPGAVLALIATNTGMGKTTFLMNVLIDAVKRGEVVLNYSAELSTSEYANLVAAHVLRKDRNTITPEDYKIAAKSLDGCKFYIGRNPDLNTADKVLDLIEAGIRRLGATVVCLDHFHFVTRDESDTIKAQENAARRIKNIAQKYGVKFINVGQPRKANQQTKGKVIHITDAKGSESFMSDADAGIAIHREMVKNIDPNAPPKEPYDSLTKIYLMKGRSQGTGDAYTELMFVGNLATFREITHVQQPFESKGEDGLF